MSNPFDYDYDDLFAPVGARNNRGRKKKKKSRRKKARRNMESEFTDERKRLSRAQVLAGFGGAEARDNALALENPRGQKWHDPRYRARAAQTRWFSRAGGAGKYRGTYGERAGQGKGGYWGSHGQRRLAAPFRGAAGQFSPQQYRLEGNQPLNRRNPDSEAAAAMHLHHNEGISLKKAWKIVKNNPGYSPGYDTGSADIYRERRFSDEVRSSKAKKMKTAQYGTGDRLPEGVMQAVERARKKARFPGSGEPPEGVMQGIRDWKKRRKTKQRKTGARRNYSHEQELAGFGGAEARDNALALENSGSPWGHDMPTNYSYAMGQGPYGTYNAVAPTNRRNPKRDTKGRFVSKSKKRKTRRKGRKKYR